MIRSDRWTKSSRSSGNGGACVELMSAPGVIRVRDSKDPNGPVLTFGREEFRGFVEGLK